MGTYERHPTLRATGWTVAGLLFALVAFGGLLSARYHPIGGLWAAIVFGGFAFASFKERRRLMRLPRER